MYKQFTMSFDEFTDLMPKLLNNHQLFNVFNIEDDTVTVLIYCDEDTEIEILRDYILHC